MNIIHPSPSGNNIPPRLAKENDCGEVNNYSFGGKVNEAKNCNHFIVSYFVAGNCLCSKSQ
jgi:hypothetical protein